VPHHHHLNILYRPVSSRPRPGDTPHKEAMSEDRSSTVAECLDFLSTRTLVCLIACCALVFVALIFVIISAINNPICVYRQKEEELEKNEEKSDVNLTGTFQLKMTDNYANYLLALDIPYLAANQIEKLKSENVSIHEYEVSGTTITTTTPWITKSISFHFDEQFNVTYGDNEESSGVLSYFCSKPKYNIINCKSINESKGWIIMFDYIFTKKYLINKSYFISKNVGMTKKYRRLAI